MHGTRERILTAAKQLLAEGAFHDATVDDVARRAGVARATLYLHVRSRPELIEGVCASFAATPSPELGDPEAALDGAITAAVAFWSADDAVLQQLYGIAAIDPAARALVERQREDRRDALERLVRHLRETGSLRDGVTSWRALQLLLVLTSYETFRELRSQGLDQQAAARTLHQTARSLLL
jgi:AcrR family transcriptional regulator